MRVSSLFLATAFIISTVRAQDVVLKSLGRRSTSGDCTATLISAGAQCQQLCPPNQTPQIDGTCVCHQPYKLVKGGTKHTTVCQPICKNGFVLSADLTTCICSPTKFLSHDKTTCWSTCPTSTFPDTTKHPGRCVGCIAGTKTCTGQGVGYATSCTSVNGIPYYLDATRKFCVKNCPFGFYGDSGTLECESCQGDGVETCVGPAAGQALSCGRLAAGYSGYLYEGNCVPPWDNPVGYWLSVGPDPFALPGNLLFPCDAGVLGCFGNGPGEAWKCGSDDVGPLYLNRNVGTCVRAPDCPAGDSAVSDPYEGNICT